MRFKSQNRSDFSVSLCVNNKILRTALIGRSMFHHNKKLTILAGLYLILNLTNHVYAAHPVMLKNINILALYPQSLEYCKTQTEIRDMIQFQIDRANYAYQTDHINLHFNIAQFQSVRKNEVDIKWHERTQEYTSFDSCGTPFKKELNQISYTREYASTVLSTIENHAFHHKLEYKGIDLTDINMISYFSDTLLGANGIATFNTYDVGETHDHYYHSHAQKKILHNVNELPNLKLSVDGRYISQVSSSSTGTFAHEAGHNLGSRHDQEQLEREYNTMNHGENIGYVTRHSNLLPCYTLMAYHPKQDGKIIPALDSFRFSSPHSTCNGQALGVQDHVNNVEFLQKVVRSYFAQHPDYQDISSDTVALSQETIWALKAESAVKASSTIEKIYIPDIKTLQPFIDTIKNLDNQLKPLYEKLQPLYTQRQALHANRNALVNQFNTASWSYYHYLNRYTASFYQKNNILTQANNLKQKMETLKQNIESIEQNINTSRQDFNIVQNKINALIEQKNTAQDKKNQTYALSKKLNNISLNIFLRYASLRPELLKSGILLNKDYGQPQDNLRNTRNYLIKFNNFKEEQLDPTADYWIEIFNQVLTGQITVQNLINMNLDVRQNASIYQSMNIGPNARQADLNKNDTIMSEYQHHTVLDRENQQATAQSEAPEVPTVTETKPELINRAPTEQPSTTSEPIEGDADIEEDALHLAQEPPKNPLKVKKLIQKSPKRVRLGLKRTKISNDNEGNVIVDVNMTGIAHNTLLILEAEDASDTSLQQYHYKDNTISRYGTKKAPKYGGTLDSGKVAVILNHNKKGEIIITLQSNSGTTERTITIRVTKGQSRVQRDQQSLSPNSNVQTQQPDTKAEGPKIPENGLFRMAVPSKPKQTQRVRIESPKKPVMTTVTRKDLQTETDHRLQHYKQFFDMIQKKFNIKIKTPSQFKTSHTYVTRWYKVSGKSIKKPTNYVLKSQ